MEQKHIEIKRLPPAAIRNTQTTVNKTFSNGVSVMDTMLKLVRREMRIQDFPKVKVGRQTESEEWYAVDNRRCFLFKVVCPLLGIDLVEVDIINWTSEFGCKINQAARVGNVWTTDDASVERVRDELKLLLSSQEMSGRIALHSGAVEEPGR